MKVPDRTTFLQYLLASEGFTQYKSLSSSLNELMEQLKSSLPKESYLDFNLRNLNNAVSIAKEVLKLEEEESFALAYGIKQTVVMRLPKNQ